MIPSYIQYQSHFYRPISWRSILINAFQFFSQHAENIAVINDHGILMTLFSLSIEKDVTILGNHIISSLKNRYFISLPCHELNHLHIYLYRLEKNDFMKNTQENFLDELISAVLKNTYQLIQTVFVYVHDHLKHRTVYNQILLEKEVIQFQFSEMLVELNVLESLFLNNKIQYEGQLIISLLISLSDQLAKLSGARAILSSNIIELKFHLMLFQRLFYRSEERVSYSDFHDKKN